MIQVGAVSVCQSAGIWVMVLTGLTGNRYATTEKGLFYGGGLYSSGLETLGVAFVTYMCKLSLPLCSLSNTRLNLELIKKMSLIVWIFQNTVCLPPMQDKCNALTGEEDGDEPGNGGKVFLLLRRLK